MIVRNLSLFLSLLAMGLLALACSMGWHNRGHDDQPEAVPYMQHDDLTAAGSGAARCQELDEQLLTCSDSLDRAWRPITPPHYPEKVRRLLEIRKRYELADDASRACREAQGAPISGAALRACLSHASCDKFATCVADNLDSF